MKIAKRILVILLSASLLFALCACGRDAEQEEDGKTVTVVFRAEKETVYTVELDKIELKNGLMSVLNYLRDTEGLTYTAEGGEGSAYLTQVGDLQQDADAGKYIGIWTSDEADADVSVYATTAEWNGMTLTSSGVGASEMHIRGGDVILIGYLTY